jgi:hypothetical protein
MIEVLGVSAVILAIMIAGGAPAALALRRRGDGWFALLTDAAALGFVLVPTAIVIVDWLGIVGGVLAVLVLVGTIVVAVRARHGLPSRPDVSRGYIPFLLAATVVALVAILLRLHDVNFLPWVGDMGAYVNWANEFVRTGDLRSSWPPLFSSFLAIASAVFGPASTTAGLATTGVVLLALLARLLGQLRVGRWVTLLVVALMAVNIHAVWFATFPGSESLNAPIVLLLFSLVTRLLDRSRTDLPLVAGAIGLTLFALTLLRGSGPFLLAPLFVLAVLASAVPDLRAWAGRAWLAFTVGVAGAAAGIWYGIAVIPRYFVEMQLGFLLPDALLDAGKRFGVLTASPVLASLLLTGTAALALVTWLVGRRHRHRAPGTGRAFPALGIALGAVLALEVVLELVIGTNVGFILIRTGILVVVLAVAGSVLSGLRLRDDRFLVVGSLGAMSVVLLAFHTTRLGGDRFHSFYLYWDRYLFSEVIPALAVMAGVGLSVGWAIARERFPRLSTRPALAGGIAGAVTLAVVALPSAPALAVQSQHGYLDGAYDFTERLLAHTESDVPMLWGATSDDPAPGFFFPNTWMAFAIPLERTFGVEFENVSQGDDNFQPDDVIIPQELAEIAGDGAVLVFETDTGEGRPLDERLPSTFTVTEVAVETSALDLLAQPPAAGWTVAQITVRIWSVSAG